MRAPNPPHHRHRRDTPVEDPVRVAGQIVAIEQARAYVERTKKPIDMTNAGQLAGHLMEAEVLLAEIVEAFSEPATA